MQISKSVAEKRSRSWDLAYQRRRREVSADQRPKTNDRAFLRSNLPAESQGKFRGGQSYPTGKNSARKTPKPPAKWHLTFPPAREDPENPEKSTIGVLEKLEIIEKNAFTPAPGARLSKIRMIWEFQGRDANRNWATGQFVLRASYGRRGGRKGCSRMVFPLPSAGQDRAFPRCSTPN